MQARTGRSRARTRRPARKLAKRTPAELRCDGPRLHAHPGLGDHAERALRAGEHAVGARRPAPDPGSRRDSHTPAGVIARTDSTKSSMCVHRVAKWPAARVAIQPPSVENSNDCGKWRSVSAVLARAGPRARGRARRPGCAPRARRRRPRARGRARPGRSRPRRCRRRATSRGDAADDRGAAAERDRGDALGRAPLEQRARRRASSRGRSDEVGGMLEAPAKAAHDVRVGLAERVRRARVRVGRRRSPPATRGALDARRRAARPLERHGLLDLAERDAQVRRRAPAAAARICAGVGCWSSKPQPQCLRRRSLTARESMRQPECRGPHSLAFAPCPPSPSPHSQVPEILARGPWALEQVTRALARGALRALAGAHAGRRRGDQGAAGARLAEPRRRGRAPGRTTREERGRHRDRAAAAALGAAAGRRRRLAERGRAVRDARGRRPLAGRPARAAGSPRGPGAGRSAPAARSTSARARPTRSCAS